MSDLQFYSAIALIVLATAWTVFALFKVFYPAPVNPVRWDDEINGDWPHIEGGKQ